MSSVSSGTSGPTSIEAKRQANALLILLLGNMAVGLAFLAFLLALPSDPENASVGRYSLDRVLLLSGILVPTLTFAIAGLALTLKGGWRLLLGERILGIRGWVRLFFPIFPALLAALCLVPLLFSPERLGALTTYHYVRLSPYLLWPVLFLGSFAVGYGYLRTHPRLRLAPRTVEGIGAVSLFLLSFATRAPLSGFGLPYQSVWDEVVTYPRALELLSGKAILEADGVPGYGRASYGDSLIYMTAAGQAAGLIRNLRSGRVSSVDRYSSPADGVGTVFEAVHDSGAPLQYPRLLFALVSSLSSVLIYLALRRHFGVSLWAAAAGGMIFAILSPDVIYYSSFIMPDGMATTLGLAAALAGMEVIRGGGDKWPAGLACGVLVGAAVGASIRYASLVPMPFVALALARNRRRWVEQLAAMIGGLVAGFVLTSPTLISDLPSYLARMAGLGWDGDDSLANRIVSLSFYTRGAFLQQGFGLVVLGMALVGYAVTLQRHWRHTLFLTVLAALHLLLISSTVYRVTRHALVLYPFVAIYAAAALGSAQDHLPAALARWQMKWMPENVPASLSQNAAGAVVLLGFLVVSLPKGLQTVRYVEGMRSFVPSQVRLAEYMRGHLKSDTKVGLLEIVPFADVHLRRSRADVHRVSLMATLDELREGGYEYVIGTGRIGKEFGNSQDTIWVSELLSENEVVAQFGGSDLSSRGSPVGDIRLYLARVPPLGPDP